MPVEQIGESNIAHSKDKLAIAIAVVGPSRLARQQHRWLRPVPSSAVVVKAAAPAAATDVRYNMLRGTY
jgi:hypothetical protein